MASKFTDEEKAAILAESYAALERLSSMPPPTDEPAEPGREWRLAAADGQPDSDADLLGADVSPKQRPRQTTDAMLVRIVRQEMQEHVAREIEAKCTAMIDQAQAKQKDYVSQLLMELLAAFRDDIMREVDAAFAELRKQLAELRKVRGSDDGKEEPIDLPNPLATRRLQ